LSSTTDQSPPANPALRVAPVGATSICLDPDADATVTIDAAALLALRPDELSQGQ
jgi:hypothetical protein